MKEKFSSKVNPRQADGRLVRNDKGLQLRYFVLKPKGTSVFANASRKAMLAYAKEIKPVNQQMATEIVTWVSRESYAAMRILEQEK